MNKEMEMIKQHEKAEISEKSLKLTKDYQDVLRKRGEVEEKEAATKKEKKKEETRTMEEFLADPKEQLNARELGEQVQGLVSRNWFDTKRYTKKTKRGIHEAYFQLNLLESFGHLAVKGLGNNQRYKVVFDTVDQQKLVQDKIDHHTFQVKIFKNQLKELKKRQKILDKKKK